jgi:formylglycine-generating enzyme required for sulfatase activity
VRDPELEDIQRWRAATPDVRREIAAKVARGLGPDFRTSDGDPDGRVQMVWRRDQWTYVLVPGGHFDMGLQDSELSELQGLDEDGALASVWDVLGRSLPVRRVHVRPFLCAAAPLLRSEAELLVRNWERVERPDYEGRRAPVALSPGETEQVLAATGARLLSEAEFEFVAREGGVGGWIARPETQWRCEHLAFLLSHVEPDRRTANHLGVWGLEFGEWVGDEWHDSYDGAPSSSVPWGAASRPGVARSGALSLFPWQVGSEYLMCHAAIRFPSDVATCWDVRLALDVPEGG